MDRYGRMGDQGNQSLTREAADPPIGRRIFHLIAGSVLPLAALFAPQGAAVLAYAVLTAVSLGLDLARFRIGWLNQQFLRWLAPLLKGNEGRRITGATYMVIAGLLAFSFFHTGAAVAAMLFLSLGDPVAGLVGRRMKGPRLFGKSPGGTAAFIVVALAVVFVLVVSGAIEYHWGLLVGAVVAGLVELAPLPPDDNLTIPLISGAVMHYLVV